MTKINDLRSYLEVLSEHGRLSTVEKPVDLVHELADVAATLARQSGKGVIFKNFNNSGDQYPWQLFANAVVDSSTAALALECEVSQIIDRMGAVLDITKGIQPEKNLDKPKWMENILTGDDIDLNRLPIPTHGLHDGGPFITGGVVVTKDPVTGRGNLSYNRMQVLGKHTFGFNVNEWRHVMQFYKIQQAKGEGLQVAVVIGIDPAISIAGGARYDGDELAIAGAIRDEAVAVHKGVTVDIDVPTHAEIVIEGYLPPNIRQKEGPLAEFHGYYGELWESPVFEVTAVCFRDNPIFQTIVPGWDEHIYIGNVLPREPLLLRFVKHVSQNVTGLHIPPYGNGFSAIVQIKKSNPGEPYNVAMGAFTAHVNIKQVIVVDPDVNIYDPADILWAITNRVDWSKDMFLVPGAQGHEMDPTADMRGVHTKIGIDATYKPERRNYGERIRYPMVNLKNYLSE
ncbi:MAG: UbiD family decarboxylase [Chloroflexi bacterium HGW-Chloroflexi-10]|nr:MAG: UbiD family decarboxylase [Chloroflexi bacterium HGW-Chloroflexi-10]